MVASDEKVREETSDEELLKEPISLSFGAQQLVNEESRGDEVVGCRRAFSRYSQISSHVLKPVCKNDCKSGSYIHYHVVLVGNCK